MLLLPGAWERIRAKEINFILLPCASLSAVHLPECFCSVSLCVLRCLGRVVQAEESSIPLLLVHSQSSWAHRVLLSFSSGSFPLHLFEVKAVQVRMFHPGGSVLVQEAWSSPSICGIPRGIPATSPGSV